MLCQDCPKKETCTELCEKAERHIRKDHVSQREKIFPHIRESWESNLNPHLDNFSYHLGLYNPSEISSYFTEESVNFPFLTPLQNKILHLFYFQGLTYKQIASRLSSANQHGVYVQLPSKAVDNQLVRARKEIQGFFSKNRGGLGKK